MRAGKALWRDKDGSVLIEATILMPMLLALVLGVFEFSWIFFEQQLVEIGVRDAARYMARIPITSTATPQDTNPCDQTDPNGTSYTTDASNIAVYGTTSTGTQRVSGWTGPVTITCATTDNSAGNYADNATIYTIQATTDFTDATLQFFGFLGLKSPTMTVTHNERYIGPG